MTAERPISYDLEMQVITSWNGAGTPLVFSSRENCEAALSLYEELNKDASMPWTYARGAVNGDRVLDLFTNGLRPWKVTLSADLQVMSCRIIPIHHIALKLVTERYEFGAPRTLEVWAPTREFALQHTNRMLQTEDRVKLLHDMNQEWSFDHWVAGHSRGAEVSTPAKEPGLEDEVDFYSDEQKEKFEVAKETEIKKVPVHNVTKLQPKAPPTPSFIPGFGNVLDLGKL